MGTSPRLDLFILLLGLALLTCTSSAEAQTSGFFAPTRNMTTARALHTATLLNNGKVLIAGGETDRQDAASSAELYDPDEGTFAPTGSMTIGRTLHSATLLANGKVLITGGRRNAGREFLASLVLLARGFVAPKWLSLDCGRRRRG